MCAVRRVSFARVGRLSLLLRVHPARRESPPRVWVRGGCPFARRALPAPALAPHPDAALAASAAASAALTALAAIPTAIATLAPLARAATG